MEIEILLKKVNKIVENIDTDELIKSIELDEKLDSHLT